MRGFWVYSLQFIVYSLLFVSCSSEPKNLARLGKLPEIYPDYIGVTIPADIAPLNFNLTDDTFDCMDVVAFGSKGGEIHTHGKWADFDMDDWHQLTEQNKGGKITLTVRVETDGHWAQYDDFDIFVTGPDQIHDGFQRAMQWCREHGKQVVVLPRTEGISSSQLKTKIMG